MSGGEDEVTTAMSENEHISPKGAPGQPGVVGAGDEKIKGVFSTQSVAKVGTGTTQRKTIQKTYWSVEEGEGGVVNIQPLNTNYVPSGPKRQIPREDFLAKFNPEPEFYVSTVYPKMQELENAVRRGEKHRSRGANYSAEFEFQNATSIDESNVRANFGLGLTYLDRGESTKANDIFERLVKLDAAFEKEHKHLFNDFGINLRKNRMFDQALEYYLRAEELVKNDENLYHNIARVYYEKCRVEKCIDYLKKSLDVNPDMEESRRFWEFLKERGLLSAADAPPKSSGKAKPAPQAATAPQAEGGDDAGQEPIEPGDYNLDM